MKYLVIRDDSILFLLKPLHIVWIWNTELSYVVHFASYFVEFLFAVNGTEEVILHGVSSLASFFMKNRFYFKATTSYYILFHHMDTF